MSFGSASLIGMSASALYRAFCDDYSSWAAHRYLLGVTDFRIPNQTVALNQARIPTL
jgi:hypothetical protein